MLLWMAKFFYFLLSFSFNHLKQCIIEVQRAIGRLRQNNVHNWHPKEGTFSEKELSQAENIIQRSIQYYHFKQEIKILSMLEGNDSQFQDCRSARKRNSIVILNCNLHKLDSFIDKEGLLRVGGWLKSVTSSYAIKHTVILSTSFIMRSSIIKVTAWHTMLSAKQDTTLSMVILQFLTSSPSA